MPGTTFFQFLKQIGSGKGNYPFTILFGFNEYLGEQVIKTFCNTVLDNKSDFNYRRFYFDSEDCASWEEVINEATSSSFFVQSNKIVVATIREEKYLTINKSDKELLKDYVKNPNNNTIFILYISLNLIKDDYKQAKRQKIDKLVKELDSPGTYSVDLDKMTERDLKSYIYTFLKESGVSITASAMDKMFEVKEDHNSILSQLPRIAVTETNGKGIDSQDIEKMLSGVEAHSIWDLTDAIEAEDAKKYLKVLKYLFMNGIKPTLIIGTLITHYNKLFIAKFLLKHRTPVNEIGKVLNQRFFLDRFIDSARRFSEKRLQRIMELIYKLDYESKTTGEHSAKLSLENFAFRIKFMTRS